MLLNAWSGVRAVNPLWLRAGSAMGAGRARAVLEGDRARRLALHHHRPAPGVPARLDRGGRRRDAGRLRLGARLGDLRRQGVPQRRRDARLAAVIGLIGFVFERLVFGALERATVQRWGMVRAVKG